MSSSAYFTFTDPYAYQTAIRNGQVESFPTTRGDFRAELTQVNLHRLLMQRGHESLPGVSFWTVNPDRTAIGFLTEAHQPAILNCGTEVSPGHIIVNSRQSMHQRTEAALDWGTMSLTPNDLAAASKALTGHELTVAVGTCLVRPSSELMSRLLKLHETAGQLAKATPDILAHVEVARALEQALIHAMVRCLMEGSQVELSFGGQQHSMIMGRLEEFLAANFDRSIYLAELCTAVGASERTLRACCQEHLGMTPIRYLCLRRLHLARRRLLRAEPETTTVTEIATEFGFWQLGRFAVEYRALFGELPSVSLSRPADDWRTTEDRPSTLQITEFE
jgi:AraC-like DNA-binding protein